MLLSRDQVNAAKWYRGQESLFSLPLSSSKNTRYKFHGIDGAVTVTPPVNPFLNSVAAQVPGLCQVLCLLCSLSPSGASFHVVSLGKPPRPLWDSLWPISFIPKASSMLSEDMWSCCYLSACQSPQGYRGPGRDKPGLTSHLWYLVPPHKGNQGEGTDT